MKKKKVEYENILACLFVIFIIFLEIMNIQYALLISSLIFNVFNIIEFTIFHYLFVYGTLVSLTFGFLLCFDISRLKFYKFVRVKDIFYLFSGYVILRISTSRVLVDSESGASIIDPYWIWFIQFILGLFLLYNVFRNLYMHFFDTIPRKFSSFDRNVRKYLTWCLRKIPEYLRGKNIPEWAISMIYISSKFSYNLGKRAHEIENRYRYGFVKFFYESDREIKKGLEGTGKEVMGPCGFYMEILLPEKKYNRRIIMLCKIFCSTFSTRPYIQSTSTPVSRIGSQVPLVDHIKSSLRKMNISVISHSEHEYGEFEDLDTIKVLSFKIFANPDSILNESTSCLVEPCYVFDQGQYFSRWHFAFQNSEYIGSSRS